MPDVTSLVLWTVLPLDGFVPILIRAPQLQHLMLSTTLTDAGLERLGNAPKLCGLAIKNNKQVTAAGVKKLREALPDCKIDWDWD